MDSPGYAREPNACRSGKIEIWPHRQGLPVVVATRYHSKCVGPFYPNTVQFDTQLCCLTNILYILNSFSICFAPINNKFFAHSKRGRRCLLGSRGLLGQIESVQEPSRICSRSSDEAEFSGTLGPQLQSTQWLGKF